MTSSGWVEDDGYTYHEATPVQTESTGLLNRRLSSRRSSKATRRSMLSQTSDAMSQRAFFLPSGGIGASVFNLCSATLGAGVLALPQCDAFSGMFLASFYVFLSGAASCYAICVLVMVSKRTGYMSYEEMSLKILGSTKWVYVSVSLIALLCFGTAVGYIITIGDILDPFRNLIKNQPWLTGQKGRIYSQIAWWCLFYLPASLPKHVNALRFASCVGVIAIAFLLIVMSIHLGENKHKPSVSIVKSGASSLFSLPVIMFGYGCQVNTFEIYSEMHNPSVKRMSIVSVLALSICSSYYILAGLIGYADFGELVQGNVLKNFDPTQEVLAGIAFFGVSVTVTMAFPLCVFPTRDAIHFLLWHNKADVEQIDFHEGNVDDQQARNGDDERNVGGNCLGDEMSDNQRRVLVLIISAAILLSGLFIPNITTVFGPIGGLCVGLIGYSIPAMFALYLKDEWTVAKVGYVHVICTYLLFVYGLFTAIGGTAVSIYHIATS